MKIPQKLDKEYIEVYEKYLADSQSCIQEFFNYSGKNWDFSVGSLKELDEFLARQRRVLSHSPNTESLSKDESWIIVRVAYYLAEVLIKNFSAKYIIDETPNSFSFGRPVIRIGIQKIEPLNLVFNIWKKQGSFAEWIKINNFDLIPTND